MFDKIRCEIPLPDSFEGVLQTKSLDCLLTNLLITKAGRLLIEDVKYEQIPPEERKPARFTGGQRQ